MFVRFESFRSFLRHYPVVSIIVALNLFIFLVVNLVPYYGNLIAGLMIGRNLNISFGEYWRLVTPMFLHVGFSHVLFNCFSTVLFAPALERILGKWKFVILYVGAGIIANVAAYFLQPPIFSHLGSSGAVFGLFGVYIYMVLFRKDLIDRASTQIIIVILVLGLVMTFLTPNIDILGHLFGLIGGLLLAPPLLAGVPLHFSWRPTSVEPRPRRRNQDATAAFDPNRWKKRKVQGNTGDTGKKVLWVVLGLFIIFGIISWFM